MLNGPGLGAVAGIASALAFGTGDFAGGVAARRVGGLPAAALAQLVGCVALLGLTAILRPALPAPVSLALGAASGVSGAIGVAALYRALAAGAMGLVASISGVGTVAIPLLVSVYLLGTPIHPLQLAGVACAAAAVVAAGGASRGRASREALLLALLAALGFGLWSVFLDRAAVGSPTWALTSSRVAGTAFVLVVAASRGSLRPARVAWRPIGLSGICDVGGNALFVAARANLAVGLAAALAGIYPLVTMLLARAVLREHLPPLGLLGVSLALLAIVLITAG